MGPFLFMAIVALVIGGILGWFSKAGTKQLLLLCLLVTVATFLSLEVILAGPPESYSLSYLVNATAYLVFPYLIFLLVPSVITAFVVRALKRKAGL
jgi:hypothetical protein